MFCPYLRISSSRYPIGFDHSHYPIRVKVTVMNKVSKCDTTWLGVFNRHISTKAAWIIMFNNHTSTQEQPHLYEASQVRCKIRNTVRVKVGFMVRIRLCARVRGVITR